MKNKNTILVTQGAMIAAMYVALTCVFAPISFREVQVRVAEALTILPVFTPAAIPGLFIGCLLAIMTFTVVNTISVASGSTLFYSSMP